MINPTLERAAIAAADYIDETSHGGKSDEDFTTGLARAVLMAVLPDGEGSISDIVVCDYIRAILAEGE